MMSISLKWLCNKILIENDWDVNVRDVNVAVSGIMLYFDKKFFFIACWKCCRMWSVHVHMLMNSIPQKQINVWKLLCELNSIMFCNTRPIVINDGERVVSRFVTNTVSSYNILILLRLSLYVHCSIRKFWKKNQYLESDNTKRCLNIAETSVKNHHLLRRLALQC
jgi:hypothetical protein